MNIVFLVLGNSSLAMYHCLALGERLNYLWKFPVSFINGNIPEERRKTWHYRPIISQNKGMLLTYANVTRSDEVEAYLGYADLLIFNVDLYDTSAIAFFQEISERHGERVMWIFGNLRSEKLPIKCKLLHQWRINPIECQVIPYNALMVENYTHGDYVQSIRGINPWYCSPMQDIYLQAVKRVTMKVLVTAERAVKEVV